MISLDINFNKNATNLHEITDFFALLLSNSVTHNTIISHILFFIQTTYIPTIVLSACTCYNVQCTIFG